MDAPARRSHGGDIGGNRAGRAGAVTALARRLTIALALAAFAAAALPFPAAAQNPPATAAPKAQPAKPKPPAAAPSTPAPAPAPAGSRIRRVPARLLHHRIRACDQECRRQGRPESDDAVGRALRQRARRT